MPGTTVIGKVAAVTGAGRGIGRATAEALVAAGARVAVGDLDASAAARVAEDLGPAAIAAPLDVTSRASFAAFLGRTGDAFGPLDVLVNNAGIMLLGDFVKEEDEATRTQVEVNVHGVLLGMKLALPGMLERGRGQVVNIASVAGRGGYPGGATYCATKHAVMGASEAVRAETRGTGVTVSCVLPNVVRTELAAGLGKGRMPVLAPADVADAVLHAVRTRDFEVYAPRSIGVLSRLIAPLTYDAKAAIARLLGADRVLRGASQAERAAYEREATGAAPGAPGT
jgi:NADP-dependent 3-hydroxy acid dehydrogenase YdfG